MPTQALPFLMASPAYSTWKRRPCGDHTVVSVSLKRGVANGRENARSEDGGEAACGWEY